MHRRVIRISSGGVHNICIIEAQPSCILKDVYLSLKDSKFTDVIFKGFYTTEQLRGIDSDKGNQQYSNDSSEKASDDDMKDET